MYEEQFISNITTTLEHFDYAIFVADLLFGTLGFTSAICNIFIFLVIAKNKELQVIHGIWQVERIKA
jgi:hypothetical protein